MPIDVICPGCHKLYRVADEKAGKKVRCRECSAAISVPAATQDAEEGDILSNLGDIGAGSSSSSGVIPVPSRDRNDDDSGPEWTSSVNPWDLSASMSEIKHRLVPRPYTPFVYPLSDVVESFLPWLLIGFGLVPAAIRAGREIYYTPRPWVGYTQLALLALMFFAIVIPATCRGLRSAAKTFKFRLPESIYFRVLAAFSTAIGMGALFYGQLDWNGFYFGFGVGTFLAVILLAIMFSLLPAETIFVALFTAAFFLTTSIAAGYVVTSVEPLMNLLAPPPKQIVQKKPIPKPTTVATTAPTPAAPAPAAPKPTPGNPLLASNVPVNPTVQTTEPAKPEPANTVELKTNSPAVMDVSVLKQPAGFDQVIYEGTQPTGMAVVRRGSDSDQIEGWSLLPPINRGAATFKHQPGSSEHYEVSPSGEMLVRLTNWPRLSALVWSFEAQRVVRTIDLAADRPNAVPELLALPTNDLLVVRWENHTGSGTPYALENWDLKIPRVIRTVAIPAYVPHGIAFSPDGKLVALAISEGTTPAHVEVFDMIGTQTRAKWKLPLTLDPRLPLTVAGISFSTDSTKLALMCQNNDNLLINVWPLAGNSPKPVEHIYAAGTLPLVNLANFPGRCFDWLPDGKAWLLYGNVLIDTTTGAFLDNLGLTDILGARVIQTDMVQEEFTAPTGSKMLAQVKLDLQKVDEERRK
jgi:hypothetical protein